ncbi:hypothetical protein [Oceanicaulis sp. MMSF_3324]|uniref:hypothetical protein n=1 Tax=Oceanicaulis sp. MMSF_3324 TaxID=3046702 RepID=UPI00273DD572|nr:hypothetical protein [Oceanicaulis sp. MMSF_3324]
MIAFFALALIAADPAPLLGGPDDVRKAPSQGAVVYAYEHETYRAEGAYERSRFGGYAGTVTSAPRRSVQAGDPVQLSDGFFYGPLTGGVGDDPPRIIVVRQNGHTHYRWR